MFSFNAIRKNLRHGIGKLVTFLLLIISTVFTLLILSSNPLIAQSDQSTRYNIALPKQSKQLLAQLDLPDSLLVGSIVSAPAPLKGQKNRSSGNFNVQATDGKLHWEVIENGVPNPSIVFDVMQDRSRATDPVLFRNLNGTRTTGPVLTRSIYIANPRGATRNFQVLVYKAWYK